MDHRVPPSVPNDPEPKLCIFPASMLCENCHEVVSQHDTDSTNVVFKGGNLFSDLKQVDTLIAHLNLKRYDLKRKINRHYSPIIHKLPVDVLAIVFSFCICNHINFFRTRFQLAAPLILGAVCKDWREIVWSIPRLWSAMAIDISSSKTIFESQTSLAREWLARSGRLPLSIRIAWKRYDSSLDFAQFSTIVNSESSRWQALHISVPPKIYRLFCQPGSSAPILQSLKIFSDDFQPLLPGISPFQLGHCPRLQEIHIGDISVRLVKVPMDGLTRITISRLPIVECREIIRRSHSLVYLKLVKFALGASLADSGRNPLPTNLKTLQITVGSIDADAMCKLFEDMTAPCLEEVMLLTRECTNVSRIRVMDTFRSLLLRSGCPMRTFSLVAISFSPEPMMSLLEAMPTLKDLTVSAHCYYREAVSYEDRAGETEAILEVLARVIASQSKPTRQGFLVNLETLAFTGLNFRPSKIPHIHPIDSRTSYDTSERPLRSVTFKLYGPVEHLPKETIPFFLALKEYGITVKVFASHGIEDLLQTTIDFNKSASQSTSEAD